MAVKYAVIKIDDWENFVACAMSTEGCRPGDIPTPIADAEVIRHQDITAAPIFSAYAHMIISFRDLLESRGNLQFTGLTDIADHFHQASILAEQCPHKRLPD